jgi:hypothetical protein
MKERSATRTWRLFGDDGSLKLRKCETVEPIILPWRIGKWRGRLLHQVQALASTRLRYNCQEHTVSKFNKNIAAAYRLLTRLPESLTGFRLKIFSMISRKKVNLMKLRMNK